MPRIPESNKRYRTKDQMAEDVTLALNSPLSYGGKWSVLNYVCWQWTEFNGKYKGCQWWTEGAILQHATDPKTKRLRHEHAVPKSVVMQMLFGLEHPTAVAVKSICEKFLVGVVVMLEEDAMLSVEFYDPSSPDRYGVDGLSNVKRHSTKTANGA